MTAPHVRSVDQFTGNQAGAPELPELEQLRADNASLKAQLDEFFNTDKGVLVVENASLVRRIDELKQSHALELQSLRLQLAEARRDKRVGR